MGMLEKLRQLDEQTKDSIAKYAAGAAMAVSFMLWFALPKQSGSFVNTNPQNQAANVSLTEAFKEAVESSDIKKALKDAGVVIKQNSAAADLLENTSNPEKLSDEELEQAVENFLKLYGEQTNSATSTKTRNLEQNNTNAQTQDFQNQEFDLQF